MTSKPYKQTIAIHILPDILRIKDNQIMKFGQLIEYNMRNTFLEKSQAKSSGETIPGPFSKKSKLSVFLGHQPKFLNCLFSQYTKLRAIEIY